MITDELIKRASGEYDCEVVLRLKLERLSISRICNLTVCSNLAELSLSFNDISNICGLECLSSSLKRLDLSFNKISRIENLEEMSSLQWLDLQGNKITNIDDVQTLSSIEELKSLYLQSNDNQSQNPCCRHPSYTSIVMRLLPHLEILDGGHLTLFEATDSLQKALQSIQPDPQASEDVPEEAWFHSTGLDSLLIIIIMSILNNFDLKHC